MNCHVGPPVRASTWCAFATSSVSRTGVPLNSESGCVVVFVPHCSALDVPTRAGFGQASHREHHAWVFKLSTSVATRLESYMPTFQLRSKRRLACGGVVQFLVVTLCDDRCSCLTNLCLPAGRDGVASARCKPRGRRGKVTYFPMDVSVVPNSSHGSSSQVVPAENPTCRRSPSLHASHRRTSCLPSRAAVFSSLP